MTLAVLTDVPIAGPVGEFAALNRTMVGTLVVTLASAPSLYDQPAGVASTITLEVWLNPSRFAVLGLCDVQRRTMSRIINAIEVFEDNTNFAYIIIHLL
jgi:hypothetical protein